MRVEIRMVKLEGRITTVIYIGIAIYSNVRIIAIGNVFVRDLRIRVISSPSWSSSTKKPLPYDKIDMRFYIISSVDYLPFCSCWINFVLRSVSFHSIQVHIARIDTDGILFKPTA